MHVNKRQYVVIDAYSSSGVNLLRIRHGVLPKTMQHRVFQAVLMILILLPMSRFSLHAVHERISIKRADRRLLDRDGQ